MFLYIRFEFIRKLKNKLVDFFDRYYYLTSKVFDFLEALNVNASLKIFLS